MPPKQKSSTKILTHSQTERIAEAQTEKDICVCPDSHLMDAKLKEEFQTFLDSFASKVRGDIDENATQQKNELETLKSRFDKTPTNRPTNNLAFCCFRKLNGPFECFSGAFCVRSSALDCKPTIRRTQTCSS